MIPAVILISIAVYLSIGLLFAVPFVSRGVNSIDEGAVNAGWGFRLIIIPGTVLFWPALLNKWMKARKKEIRQDK